MTASIATRIGKGLWRVRHWGRGIIGLVAILGYSDVGEPYFVKNDYAGRYTAAGRSLFKNQSYILRSEKLATRAKNQLLSLVLGDNKEFPN